MRRFSGGNFGSTIEAALASNPKLANLSLGQLDLSRYSLSSIPGLTLTPFKEFSAWQQSFIDQVPGLNQVPFSSFPIAPGTGVGVVAQADVVWGSSEHGDPSVGSDRFVSGSGSKDGETELVGCEPGKPCAYLELSDALGGLGGRHGQRWASGETQKVAGEHGPLKAVNGGKEPTGRNVYGKWCKVVLTKTHESTGTADFGLYLRACIKPVCAGETICKNTMYVDLGCTPYFIGPIPWIPVREKDLVILLSSDKPKTDIPEQYQEQIDQIFERYSPQEDSQAGSYDPCLGRVTGKAVEKAIAAVPAPMRSYGNKTVPLVLAAAKKYGVTDPAQVAYILSTVQTETTMGKDLVEGSGTRYQSSQGTIYYGRGLVQLTHKENYQKASRLVGIDLVKNPERAAEPEIAAKILVVGMRDGLFTGRKLSDYIRNGKADFVGARWIVNDNGKTQLFLGTLTTILIVIAVTSQLLVNTSVTPRASAINLAQSPSVSAEQQQIIEAILENSQRNGANAPGVAPERVDKIAIDGPYALALVLVGDQGGGMAVLSKQQGSWQVIGGGGGWLILQDLKNLGIPERSAQVLLSAIDPNWRNYEPK